MLEYHDHQYTVQNIPLITLAERYDLPLYVYDAAKIEEQYLRFLRSFAEARMQIRYAVKALSNIHILRFMRKLGAGLDTVSIEEVELGLLAGFPPEKIIFTPNCISFEEIQRAVEKKVMVNIDDLGNLEEFGKTYSSRVPCCIRLKPHIVAGGNAHIQTGHADSKFGISIYDMPEILRLVKEYEIQVVGLHIHTGSEIASATEFLAGAEILYEAALSFPSLQFLDFGSGFKVAYREKDASCDLLGLAQEMTQRWHRFCTQYGRPVELWFEPGKFLVSEAGYFLVRTNVVKKGVKIPFVGVDSGLNHLIRPKLYKAYHSILNLTNPGGVSTLYNVVGYICETDTFAEERELPEVRKNDILCFCNAGAYGFSMSSHYNSRLKPAEVLLYHGKDYLIRKRETFADLLRNQVPLPEEP